LNLIHAVGKGSKYPPFLAALSYKGAGREDKYLALVGKGIIFDSGGLSIKPSNGMVEMY